MTRRIQGRIAVSVPGDAPVHAAALKSSSLSRRRLHGKSSRGRGAAAIRLVAAAPPRSASADDLVLSAVAASTGYPRRGRGAAAIRLRGRPPPSEQHAGRQGVDANACLQVVLGTTLVLIILLWIVGF